MENIYFLIDGMRKKEKMVENVKKKNQKEQTFFDFCEKQSKRSSGKTNGERAERKGRKDDE